MEKQRDTRARNFATVVYPESAPEGWMSILDEMHIPAFVSPIHDKDLNPTGEEKKAHYHVVIMFDGKKTMDQARDVFSQIGGVGCERVSTIRGYARYLCHLDNPEKTQYKIEDVTALSGADYTGVIGLPIDRYKTIREMCIFCRENDVDSFADLSDYAMENQFDWFRILCDSGAVYMREYLRSRTWTKEKARCTDE